MRKIIVWVTLYRLDENSIANPKERFSSGKAECPRFVVPHLLYEWQLLTAGGHAGNGYDGRRRLRIARPHAAQIFVTSFAAPGFNATEISEKIGRDRDHAGLTATGAQETG